MLAGPCRAPHQGTDGLGRAGECQIRVVGHVDGIGTFKQPRPSSGVRPVERGSSATRADPHRVAGRDQAFGHPAAGLARAADHRREARARRLEPRCQS